MNDCPNGEMRDLLPDLLHDRLAAADRARVEAHVALCADCAAELALLNAMRGMLRRAPAVDVASIVRALPGREAPARRRAWGGWRAAAAIAAIAVGGTSVAIARHEPAASTPPLVVASADTSSVSPTSAAPVTALADIRRPQPAAPARELAVAGAVSDLSDAELASLLHDIESLDAVPAATVDVDATSLAPAASTRGNS
jgi:anti-sigma factor RsiW